MSTANLASILISLVPSRGDLEPIKTKRTKPGKSKRTNPDFAKCPLRQEPQYKKTSGAVFQIEIGFLEIKRGRDGILKEQ